MKQEDFNNLVTNRLRQIKSLMVKKQNEYADIDDVHINFKKAINLSFHDTPQKVLWEYCVKHLQSIKDIIEGKDVNYEQVQEKTGDVIAYMLILESMYIPESKLNYLYDKYQFYSSSTLTNNNLDERADK